MEKSINEKRIYIIIASLTLGSLLLAVIMQINNKEFIASIFCNMFAGFFTGCVIAFISAFKNRKKGKFILLKSAYKAVYDYNMEFLNNKEYVKYLSDFEMLYEELYSKFSHLKHINEYIEKYKNEFLKEGELASIFAEKFSYNVAEKENEYIQLHDDLQSNLYNTKRDLLELVRKYEIDIISRNISIMLEIEKCKAEIYKIDQSFI